MSFDVVIAFEAEDLSVSIRASRSSDCGGDEQSDNDELLYTHNKTLITARNDVKTCTRIWNMNLISLTVKL